MNQEREEELDQQEDHEYEQKQSNGMNNKVQTIQILLKDVLGEENYERAYQTLRQQVMGVI